MRAPLSLLLLTLVPVSLSCASTAAPSARFAAVDRLVKAYMTEHEVPGLALALVVDGKVQWTGAYGFADLENRVPTTPDTLFRSASIGKTMTATAAMRLVERHELDLDGDIRDYCPAFPAKAWRITPWNLLTHTSGIRHYGGPNDLQEQTSTFHFATVAAALVPFKDDPLSFEPGTKWQYSTYGFDVLGCVIEGAAGAPFLTVMRDEVWGPAKMTATRDDDPSAIIPDRAAKYTRIAGRIQNAPAIDMSNRLPAGGYLTTAADLGRFLEALLDGRLVDSATFERMITPSKLADGKVVGYGLGWGVEAGEWHGDRWTFHGGSSPGASGLVALMPKHRFGVAFLTNLDELPGRGELAEDITRLMLGFGSRQP